MGSREAKKLPMPQPTPFELSLRVRHPSMDPAELSRELGLAAVHSFRAGDPRRSIGDLKSLHGESYWLGTLDPSSWPAEAWLSGLGKAEAVDKALRQAAMRSLGWALSLSARRFLRVKDLFDRIHSGGGEASLLVALSPATVVSFSLPPDISRIFAELCITIEFDLTSE